MNIRTLDGYSFTPQYTLDVFCGKVETSILEEMAAITPSEKNAQLKFESYVVGDDYEVDYHSERKDLFREWVEEGNKLARLRTQLQLLDEMRINNLFKAIEIAQIRRLKICFKDIKVQKFSNFPSMLKTFSFICEATNFDAINEIRLINNCIKHSGKVSNILSTVSEEWKVGGEFHPYMSSKRPLETAYKRFQPLISSYWRDFGKLTERYRQSPCPFKNLSELEMLEMLKNNPDVF